MLLDLFCGAGGAAMGYHRAGFDVVGVDIEPQPHYPFRFIQGDALSGWTPDEWWMVDAIHASPPCQLYSAATAMHDRTRYVDLVAPTRELLKASGLPYVIENVEGAPLIDPITLCGSMFGIFRLRRHRLFESNWPILRPGPCRHDEQSDVLSVSGHGEGGSHRGGTKRGPYWGQAERRKAMGIDWMNRTELAQSIPPAYSEHVGRQLLAHLRPGSDRVTPGTQKGTA